MLSGVRLAPPPAARSRSLSRTSQWRSPRSGAFYAHTRRSYLCTTLCISFVLLSRTYTGYCGNEPAADGARYLGPEDVGPRTGGTWVVPRGVISDCHFAVQLNHFIPGFLSYQVSSQYLFF